MQNNDGTASEVQQMTAAIKQEIEKEYERLYELSRYERGLRDRGIQLICGIDEAGRGPLAGPVTAAAVILPPDCLICGIDDSKKLSAKKREALAVQIKEKAIAWACASVNQRVIDDINILEASKLAMRRAVAKLSVRPDFLLIDAVDPGIDIPCSPIIHGDALSISIAAASIIAKTTRDQLMMLADKKWPQYGFARHKGYPTALHKEALKKYGYCPLHRKSFRY